MTIIYSNLIKIYNVGMSHECIYINTIITKKW